MGHKRVVATEQAELFSFETETEVPAMLETAETVETETEVTEPTAADLDALTHDAMEDILSGYSPAEWMDVMLSTDTHTVGMSRGVAIERVYMERNANKRKRTAEAEAARELRATRNAEAKALFESARQTNVYRAMDELMNRLRDRGVIMTLAKKTVTVESLSWVKGEGTVREVVATFTYASGRYSFKLTGSKSEKYSLETAVTMLTELLPERAKDLMPRKFRDVMRTHRHKNASVTDVTGNRATRNASPADELSAADFEKYPALAMVQGPKLTVGGHVSMQGVALTADERRKRDRDRLKVWRENKRAEKLAAQA